MTLLSLIVVMTIENIRVILGGGHKVSSGAIAVFETCLAVMSIMMYLFLLHMSRKYESPTIHAEIYMWKTDIIGSCGVAAAFLANFFLGDTVLKPVTPYMDSGVAIIMSLFLIDEPDGTTTVINAVTAESMNVQAEGWYTLNGVKLQGIPTQKGIYINNGKKVVIK